MQNNNFDPHDWWFDGTRFHEDIGAQIRDFSNAVLQNVHNNQKNYLHRMKTNPNFFDKIQIFLLKLPWLMIKGFCYVCWILIKWIFFKLVYIIKLLINKNTKSKYKYYAKITPNFNNINHNSNPNNDQRFSYHVNQGFMFCPNCGRKIQKDLHFCPYCGKLLDK